MKELGIDVWQLFWQMTAFAVLVFLLWKFLYRPILAMLDERRDRIGQSMKDAQKASESAEELRRELERQRTEAKREGQAILGQAAEMSEKLKADILVQARSEAAKMLEDAKKQIEADRERSMAELQKQVADLALTVSQSVLPGAIDEQTHRRLIDDFLKKTDALN